MLELYCEDIINCLRKCGLERARIGSNRTEGGVVSGDVLELGEPDVAADAQGRGAGWAQVGQEVGETEQLVLTVAEGQLSSGRVQVVHIVQAESCHAGGSHVWILVGMQHHVVEVRNAVDESRALDGGPPLVLGVGQEGGHCSCSGCLRGSSYICVCKSVC